MNVSMDGLRNNLGAASNTLHSRLEELFEDMDGAYADQIEAIKEAFNEVSQYVGWTFAVFDPKEKHFSDMSEKIDRLSDFVEDE